MPGITKKISLYANDTDGRCLDQLSKAAVIDMLVEYLRADAGDLDTPLEAHQVAEHDRVHAVLAARGDRQLPSAAALLAKEKKEAIRQANAIRSEAQWAREKEARLARYAAEDAARYARNTARAVAERASLGL
jgi:hypothetical protein